MFNSPTQQANQNQENNMANPTITIRRPNGEIETVETPKFARINNTLFARIQEATRNAGRGEVLSYDNPRPRFQSRTPHVSDICPRCGTRCYGDCTA